MSKSILITAIAARKAFEDDKWAEKTASKNSRIYFESALAKLTIPVVERLCIDQDDYPPGNAILELYEKPEQKNVPAKDIANSIIHAYYWNIVHIEKKIVGGFLVSSDYTKKKGIYYVPLEEWINYLAKVIEISHIY